MDTMFMNSENSKMSKSHELILKLTNKLDLRIAFPTRGKILYQIFKIILIIS